MRIAGSSKPAQRTRVVEVWPMEHPLDSICAGSPEFADIQLVASTLIGGACAQARALAGSLSTPSSSGCGMRCGPPRAILRGSPRGRRFGGRRRGNEREQDIPWTATNAS